MVELNHTELATDEDRRYGIDRWVSFFKAKTWKELKALAATNQYMKTAADTIFELSTDENIRELCRRRAEYEAYERYNAAEHARKDNLIITQSNQIAEMHSEIAEKDSEIARLRQLLSQIQTQ